MSHTPEPWTALDCGDASLDVMIYGPTTLHRPICKVFDWIDNREDKGWSTKETANLIAAAPDLLAACRSLFDEDGRWKPGLKLTGEQHVLFEVAMKKAVSE